MTTTESPYAAGRARTLIAPTVLMTITRLTVLGIPGVAGLAPVPGGVNRLVRRGLSEGIRVEVSDESVAVELHLILSPDSNVREVAHRVQAEVVRAIEDTVGMPVSRVDVTIEDVDYGPAAP
jgi:uncharacterized alkaline shock family protein YloU